MFYFILFYFILFYFILFIYFLLSFYPTALCIYYYGFQLSVFMSVQMGFPFLGPFLVSRRPPAPPPPFALLNTDVLVFVVLFYFIVIEAHLFSNERQKLGGS
jgi:hypothetical protein